MNKRMRIGASLAAVLLGAGAVTMGATAASAATGPAQLTTASLQTIKPATQAQADAEWKQITDYISAHPEDLAGIEQLSKKYTGKGLVVSMSGESGSLNGAAAQKVLDKRAILPAGAKPQSKRVLSLASVPADAFAVADAWIPRPNTGDDIYAAHGTWDFRDDYVNFSAPDDIATLEQRA